MKKFLIYVLILFAKQENCFSQVNLIPNPSFEDTLSCPNGQGQVYKTPPWFDPTMDTPDYFNQCYSGGLTNVHVPDNFEGYQFARTGVAYAGFFAAGYAFFPDNRRDYIDRKSTRLNSSHLG